MANREDVLSDFAIESEMSHAVLKDYLTRYPEHAHDLLNAFNEFQMLDLEKAQQKIEPISQ